MALFLTQNLFVASGIDYLIYLTRPPWCQPGGNGYALPAPSVLRSWSFTRWPSRNRRCRIIMGARYLNAALYEQEEFTAGSCKRTG